MSLFTNLQVALNDSIDTLRTKFNLLLTYVDMIDFDSLGNPDLLSVPAPYNNTIVGSINYLHSIMGTIPINGTSLLNCSIPVDQSLSLGTSDSSTYHLFVDATDSFSIRYGLTDDNIIVLSPDHHVGINTKTPTDPLSVNGSVRADNLKVWDFQTNQGVMISNATSGSENFTYMIDNSNDGMILSSTNANTILNSVYYSGFGHDVPSNVNYTVHAFNAVSPTIGLTNNQSEMVMTLENAKFTMTHDEDEVVHITGTKVGINKVPSATFDVAGTITSSDEIACQSLKVGANTVIDIVGAGTSVTTNQLILASTVNADTNGLVLNGYSRAQLTALTDVRTWTTAICIDHGLNTPMPVFFDGTNWKTFDGIII